MLRGSEKRAVRGAYPSGVPDGFAGRLPVPTFVGAGSIAENIGAIAFASRHASIATGDIEVVVIESNTSEPATISTAGWAQVSGSPVSGADTTLSVWWHLFTSGDPLPTIDDSGDHQIGILHAFRGAGLGGRNPFDATVAGTEAASTTATVPAVTTLSWNTLCLFAVATGRDTNITDVYNTPATAAHNFAAHWANANMTIVGAQAARTAAVGGGGAIVLGIGVKEVPGSTGTSSLVMATSQAKAMLSMALR